MKSFRTLCFIILIAVATPSVFGADFGVRAGRFNDSHENFVGGEVLIDLGTINVNPNVEYMYDIDNATVGSANVDITFDVARFSHLTPYVGAGVGLSYIDDDVRGSDTSALGNLIGGLQLDLGFLKPYGQVKYVRTLDTKSNSLGDDHDLALTLGLRF